MEVPNEVLGRTPAYFFSYARSPVPLTRGLGRTQIGKGSQTPGRDASGAIIP